MITFFLSVVRNVIKANKLSSNVAFSTVLADTLDKRDVLLFLCILRIQITWIYF